MICANKAGVSLSERDQFNFFADNGVQMKISILRIAALSLILTAGVFEATHAIAQTTSTVSSSAILSAAETQKIFPASVFFKGQTAPSQGRNSGGVRLADKKMVLVSLVDNSGYSSQVQERYQAYLITETTLDIDGHKLSPGAYGCGFLAGDKFVVMDIAGNDLFIAHSTNDAEMRRPTPLQVKADPGSANIYRLYAGRSFVAFRVAGGN
jgi:hypothetical protein